MFERDYSARPAVALGTGPIPRPSAVNARDASDLRRAAECGDDRAGRFHTAKVAIIATIGKGVCSEQRNRLLLR